MNFFFLPFQLIQQLSDGYVISEYSLALYINFHLNDLFSFLLEMLVNPMYISFSVAEALNSS